MTAKETLSILKYIKGVYPYTKDSELSNVVWIDMLKDEEYFGILESVKNYIREAHEYAPNVGQIIKGYDIIIKQFANDILNKMNDDGVFNDPIETDIEIAMWNKNNRKRKALMWSQDLSKAPEWFVELYKSYEKEKKQLVFNSQKRLN